SSAPQHSCISMNWIVPAALLKTSVNRQRWFFAWAGEAGSSPNATATPKRAHRRNRCIDGERLAGAIERSDVASKPHPPPSHNCHNGSSPCPARLPFLLG